MSNQSNTAAAFPICGVFGVGEGQGTLPEAAPLSVPTEREDGPSDQPFDWSEYEDDISDAISDSIDMDWSARDGAKAVIRCLAALSASGPSGGCGALLPMLDLLSHMMRAMQESGSWDAATMTRVVENVEQWTRDFRAALSAPGSEAVK